MKKQWWHDRVAYQVYPKSFLDTNGDGIGDLRGVIEKLDYLKDLGVDIIWLSPIYKSPFIDQGYDISDYLQIDPVFGNMGDMDELLAETKRRDMYVLMDLVVNHCSSEHEWFKKALADPYGKYADYFYFRKGKDGEPPNNLRTYFATPAWSKVPGTDMYYLHMFAKEQPDLNWENPEVRGEIYDMICKWLEKGLAGFRVDAIVNIKKDLDFPSYPADNIDGLAEPTTMVHSVHGVEDMLAKLNRETFAKYDALTVAELFDYDSHKLSKFIGENGCFSTIFNFSTETIAHAEKGWYERKTITPNEYRDAFFGEIERVGDIGFLCNIIENHDEPRGVSRYLSSQGERAKKMLATTVMLAKGMPFLYQGQEIGMENVRFESIDDYDDVSTLGQYDIALAAGLSPEAAFDAVVPHSRDNARTPMQWSDKQNAGFTTGKPWLKANENYKTINVEEQLSRDDSLLNYYKKLIALRKDEIYKETFVYGKFIPAFQEIDDLMAFYRNTDEKSILVLCNFGDKAVRLDLQKDGAKVLVNNSRKNGIEANKIVIDAFGSLVLEIF